MEKPSAKFIEALAGHQGAKRDILEKDLYLQHILSRIAKDDHLNSDLVFRGGTCLIKGYLGYFRFSEDLDFTWGDQRFRKEMSITKAKRHCSMRITELIERFTMLASGLELNFSGDKSDVEHIGIHAGGRMVTFLLGYPSMIHEENRSIRVQIGFFEEFAFPPVEVHLKSYVHEIETEEIQALYKAQYLEYERSIPMMCYDEREIFIEKCRAAVTRNDFKVRDLIDILYIKDHLAIELDDLRDQIIRKIEFAIDTYSWIEENLERKITFTVEGLEEEIEKLLLIKPEPGFEEEIKVIGDWLNGIREDIVDKR